MRRALYATADDLLRFVRAARVGTLGRALAAQLADTQPDGWRGWYGRTSGYEASVDVLPAQDLVFVFVSNLLSAANWQVREQVRAILRGRAPSTIRRPPAAAPPFEDSAPLVGLYGDAEDPVAISTLDGKLFRGDNELYPVAGGRYYTPASGSLVRFRRDAGGRVDAIVTTRPDGRETVLPRAEPRS